MFKYVTFPLITASFQFWEAQSFAITGEINTHQQTNIILVYNNIYNIIYNIYV